MLPKAPVILLSVINTKLRDFYPSLDALCDDLQVDAGEITQSLSAIDCFLQPGAEPVRQNLTAAPVRT